MWRTKLNECIVYGTGFLGKKFLNNFAVQSETVFEFCLFSKVSGPPKSLSQLSKNENNENHLGTSSYLQWNYPGISRCCFSSIFLFS